MRLFLMRHTKAAAEEGQPDHDRPLTEQGVQDARTMGRWLRDHGGAPDVVWCSSALRARQTWSAVATELPSSPETPEPSYLRSVYQAGSGDLLDLLRDVAPEVESVLILGHNPTMEQALAGLTGEHHDFPAGAIAALDVTGPWSAPTAFRLDELATPNGA
ncbi:MAG: histidine phosphatase family protein [Sporichthyaceae bacterium]